jgi:hypothetical protein
LSPEAESVLNLKDFKGVDFQQMVKEVIIPPVKYSLCVWYASQVTPEEAAADLIWVYKQGSSAIAFFETSSQLNRFFVSGIQCPIPLSWASFNGAIATCNAASFIHAYNTEANFKAVNDRVSLKQAKARGFRGNHISSYTLTGLPWLPIACNIAGYLLGPTVNRIIDNIKSFIKWKWLNGNHKTSQVSPVSLEGRGQHSVIFKDVLDGEVQGSLVNCGSGIMHNSRLVFNDVGDGVAVYELAPEDLDNLHTIHEIDVNLEKEFIFKFGLVDGFGTLGIGNHFAEVCSKDGKLFLLVHCGTRGAKNQLYKGDTTKSGLLRYSELCCKAAVLCRDAVASRIIGRRLKGKHYVHCQIVDRPYRTWVGPVLVDGLVLDDQYPCLLGPGNGAVLLDNDMEYGPHGIRRLPPLFQRHLRFVCLKRYVERDFYYSLS